jgi:hypothetical protein
MGLGHFVIIVVTIALVLVARAFIRRGEVIVAQREAQQAAFVEGLRATYGRALDHLAAHPSDPSARVRALDAGREYYGVVMPDTHDVQITNGTFVTDHNFQNNTPAREARIAADIEARIGHLRVSG